jgi:hypothetical protein
MTKSIRRNHGFARKFRPMSLKARIALRNKAMKAFNLGANMMNNLMVDIDNEIEMLEARTGDDHSPVNTLSKAEDRRLDNLHDLSSDLEDKLDYVDNGIDHLSDLRLDVNRRSQGSW